VPDWLKVVDYRWFGVWEGGTCWRTIAICVFFRFFRLRKVLASKRFGGKRAWEKGRKDRQVVCLLGMYVDVYVSESDATVFLTARDGDKQARAARCDGASAETRAEVVC
jgi:hypothetical protein